jgi:hypothetical protein
MLPRLGMLLAGLALGTIAVPAAAQADGIIDPIPVLPHQTYQGSVNGKVAAATITVACPGPIGTNALGHPIAGQTIGVQLVTGPVIGPVTRYGYTGESGRGIVATRTGSSSTVDPVATFSYYTKQDLSTKLLFPCGGSGVIAFNPSPDSGGHPALVDVTFVNIGV